jgi:hypothetical protein
MALSDQLTKLSAKAKEAEDRAAAADAQANADLEQAVRQARESAQADADLLRKNAETDKEVLSEWWDDMQRTWNEHVTKIRRHLDEKKAEHDVKAAERRAIGAEEDAKFALDYAYATVQEAEYAVLDAILARKEADSLAAAAPSS